MSLSDIMGHTNLSHWAQIALVMFLVIFAGVTVYVFARRNKPEWDRARSLPLDDDTQPTNTHGRNG